MDQFNTLENPELDPNIDMKIQYMTKLESHITGEWTLNK